MKQTILIAEDEADIRNILRLYLESENYEVLEAADGESAVAAVRNGSPDLVILDIMMPKLDGFAVVRGHPAAERHSRPDPVRPEPGQ